MNVETPNEMRSGTTMVILLTIIMMAMSFSGTVQGMVPLNGTSFDNETISKTPFNSIQKDVEIQNGGYFTENLGQWDEEILFSAQTDFGNIGLGRGKVYYNIIEAPLTDHFDDMDRMEEPMFSPERFEPMDLDIKVKGHVLIYEFKGSNDGVPAGIDPLPHYCNYFIGNDETKWKGHVKNYRSVVYEDIYDDIDLKFYFDDEGVKYDLILHPYSDPDKIRIEVQGHDSIKNDGDSISFLSNGRTVLSEKELVSFYEDRSQGPLRSEFKFFDDGSIGFDLEDHDRSRTVVIDPFIFSTFIGGTNRESFIEMTMDSSGYPVIIGESFSTDYPTTSGAYDTSMAGYRDNVVTKLRSDGSDLLWSTFIGGTEGSYPDYLRNPYFDEYDNLFLAGSTNNTDFPTTSGAFDRSYNGGYYDLILLKLKRDGSSLLYSTYIGGSQYEYGYSIVPMKVTGSGEAIMGTYTNSTDFPTTPDAYDRTYNGPVGGTDIAVFKINTDGSDLVFSTFIGGQGYDYASSLTTDEQENILILGQSSSTDYPVTAGVVDTTHNGGNDAIVTILKEDGSEIMASTFIGGIMNENIRNFYIDIDGGLILTGQTASNNFPVTTGAYSETFGGNYDVFVCKLKSDLTSLVFSTYIGGIGADYPTGMTEGVENDLMIYGQTQSANFPTSPGAFDRFKNYTYPKFILRLSDNGTTMLASTLFEHSISSDGSFKVDFDTTGNLFISGYTKDDLIPTTPGADNEEMLGSYDFYFTQMSYDLTELVYSSYYGGSGSDGGSCYLSEYGDIYLAGATNSSDFPTTEGAYSKTLQGDYDILVAHLQAGVLEEPYEVYSVRTYLDDECQVPSAKFDLGDKVHIELLGQNPNSTKKDRATVNITFMQGPTYKIRLRLMETGNDTNVYRGSIIIGYMMEYFGYAQVYSKKDPTKETWITIDYPFRPRSVYSIGVYPSISGSSIVDRLDLGQTGYFKCIGEDANPVTVDKAFVNLTSDKNSSQDRMLILTETGQSTGIYGMEFTVPDTMEYFENIMLTSVETPSRTAKFMVHTPVQIRTMGTLMDAIEDEEYRMGFYNFGYSTATWTLTTDAYWLTWDNVKSELHGIPRNNDVGTELWNVLLLLKDAHGNSDSMDYKISVINSPPIITTEPVTQCYEKDDYVLDLDSDDDELGDIIWYLNTNAPFLTIDKNTGVVRGTSIEGDEGLYFVNVQVQDGNGGSDDIMFNLTVLGRNDRPSIISTDIKQIEQDTPFRRDYEVFDPDDGDTHHWTLRTDADWLSMENETGVLFGTPDGYDVGDWSVNITVIDNGGLSDSREYTLKVLDKKDKPRWVDVPSDMELVHGTEYYFDANATDPDMGDTLDYMIETGTECDMRVNSKTGEVAWKANYRCMPRTGGIQVKLKVSDGELFSTHEFVITVTPTQSPTVEITSPSKGSRTPSTETKLEWIGSDPEDEPLTYILYIGDSESYVTAKRAENIKADDISGDNYTLTGLTQGETYYWMVVPDDGCTFGMCTNGAFSFRVNNRPVLKEVEARTVGSGNEFRLKLEGSDGDQDDTLKYSIVSGPEGMTVREETGMIIWTPKEDQEGIHKVRVRVTDGYETTDRTFDIEVNKGEGSDLLLIIVLAAVIGLLVLIILLYLFVFKGRAEREREKHIKEEVEARELEEEMAQKQKEREWEEAHTRDSDHTVVSDVPISAMDAHAHDREGKPKSYEELYGARIPEEGEE